MSAPDVLSRIQPSIQKPDQEVEQTDEVSQTSHSVPYVTYEKLESEAGSKLDAMFGLQDCLLRVNPGRVVIPPKFKDMGEAIHNMEVRPDDVWVVSFPRTGSTWAQEMVWLLGHDLDYKGAGLFGQIRNPLLELTALVANDPGDWKNEIPDSLEYVQTLQSPRFIKTHIPLCLLPKQMETVKPKIVYVARNPKDVCVSYYHYCKLIHHLQDPDGKYFDDFCELFLQGNAPMGPICPHMLEFWNKRHEDNILFLKYEDMKKDQKAAILQTAKFLGKEISDENITALIDHLSFNKMKENPATNLEPLLQKMQKPVEKRDTGDTFLRKGVVGDYKNQMSEELIARFDSLLSESLADTGLSFDG